MSSKKKRRISRIESSDEDLPPSTTPENHKKEEDNDSNCRKSSRIKQRQNKVFQKPSREEIWDKIPSSSEKDLSRITPTKKINNFTKVFSYYNAESYDLFNDDFINDEEEIEFDSTSISTDSEEEEHLKTKRMKKKIKNRRKRLKFESSSSDEGVDVNIKDEKDTDETSVNADEGDSNSIIALQNQDKGDNLGFEQSNSSAIKVKGGHIHGDNSIQTNFEEYNTGNESDIKNKDENSSQTKCKGDNLKEESDFENKGGKSQIDNGDSDVESQILFSHSKNKNILKSDSESEQSDKQGSKKNSEDSESDSDTDNLSRSEKQLVEKESRFQNFKQAQARFKERQRRLKVTETVAQKQK